MKMRKTTSAITYCMLFSGVNHSSLRVRLPLGLFDVLLDDIDQRLVFVALHRLLAMLHLNLDLFRLRKDEGL